MASDKTCNILDEMSTLSIETKKAIADTEENVESHHDSLTDLLETMGSNGSHTLARCPADATVHVTICG